MGRHPKHTGCIIEGCESRHQAKGYCDKHYRTLVVVGQQKPLWHIWRGMLDRCYNPKGKRYPDWGGRGVTVCAEWRISYAAFATYMGERPKGSTLDRIDNDKNYEPGNVRWATPAEQAQNRRKT